MNKINNIINVSNEELLAFFNVNDLSVLRLVSPDLEVDEDNDSMLILVKEKHVNDIIHADKLAYLVSDKLGNYSINYFYEHISHTKEKADFKTINIHSRTIINHQFIIDYNLEKGIMQYEKTFGNAEKQSSDYELCFKDCIGDELERISESNWFRQTRFLISAPLEFFYIMVECGIDCAT